MCIRDRCMNLLAVSGCDSVVQSAVVEEKNPTDQKREENKETVQKTVAEQVEAPETYQTTIQADLRSADREDKENPMKFTPVSYTHLDVYKRQTCIWANIEWYFRMGYGKIRQKLKRFLKTK